MEAIKNFWKRIYGYYKKNDKKPAAVPQNGEAEPKSMDGVKESRAKPSGSGLNKKHVIGAFGIIALLPCTVSCWALARKAAISIRARKRKAGRSRSATAPI